MKDDAVIYISSDASSFRCRAVCNNITLEGHLTLTKWYNILMLKKFLQKIFL